MKLEENKKALGKGKGSGKGQGKGKQQEGLSEDDLAEVVNEGNPKDGAPGKPRSRK